MIPDAPQLWIQKAEHDLKIANDELLTEDPANDMICFHAQQCVEKYLKAYLVANALSFRKTHDIAELLEICKDKDAEFGKLYPVGADRLTVYGTEIRYPDDFYFPSRDEAAVCINIAEQVRAFVLNKMNIPPNKG